jgi:hypothetical protein
LSRSVQFKANDKHHIEIFNLRSTRVRARYS